MESDLRFDQGAVLRGDPRIWKVTFNNSFTGTRVSTAPLTRDEAELRMRSTQWRPGAQPKIEKVKE